MAENSRGSLDAFLHRAPDRIAALADPHIESAVPKYFQAAAVSIARQAAGGWTIRIADGSAFVVQSALREFLIGADFEQQCVRVAKMILESRNPEIRLIVDQISDAPAAIQSAFFHYFMAHEFVHVEQGLGSDQYKDSDLYMPVVMEADHVADVAGLAVATHANIPELIELSERSKILLLIAIHIASMHSFAPVDELDAYAFNRLLIWYLHFARLSKSPEHADLGLATMTRQWTVTLPRLLGRAEQTITSTTIIERAASPYPASSDVVLAFHQDDGLYRIHRAALTDPRRIERLCKAILQADFDAARIELEELLVNNPALVPASVGGAAPNVEWAAGSLIEAIEMLGRTAAATSPVKTAAINRLLDDHAAYARVVRASSSPTPGMQSLLTQARETIEMLAEAWSDPDWPEGNPSPASLRRQALSIVDQIVIEQAADQSV